MSTLKENTKGAKQMKKALVLCVLIIFMAFPAHALKITVAGKVEMGTDIESYNAFLDVDLGLNIYFWKCRNYTYGGSRTWFVPDWNELSGYPFREIYYCGNRFYIAGFFVDFKHFCNHAVKSNHEHSHTIEYNGEKYYTANNKWYSNFWGEDMTTISIGYEFELPVYNSKK